MPFPGADSKQFKERKTYNPETSVLKKKEHHEDSCKEQKTETIENELLLFTTPTCPNCMMAKTLLNKAGIKYRLIDATVEKELTRMHNVMKAPTLLVPNKDHYDYYDNASEIKRYIEITKQ